MRSEIGNLFFLGWPNDNPLPLPVGVAPSPWIPFIMVMVTHISENASEKPHYFALAFTGMNSVPSRLRELWRQPVYTRASLLHALSCACACTEKHPLTTVSVMRTW